jgi:hypothetical protein
MSRNNGYDEFHDEDFNKDIPINGPSESENRGNQNQNKNPNSQFVINGNSNITEEVSNITVNYVNNYLGFIGKYFNVELNDVISKLKGACIPFNKSFYESVENTPELYGPFWTFTTIIFLITVTSNLSGYLSSDKNFSSNFNFMPYAALFIYGFGFGAPLIIYLLSKFSFKVDIDLITNICVYGYSFVILIPVLFICAIPSEFIETICLLYYLVHSSIFLFYNVYLLISEKAPRAKYAILGIIGGIQLFLFFALKFYFFKNIQKKSATS